LDFVRRLPSKKYIIFADSFDGGLSISKRLHTLGYQFVLGCGKNRPKEVFADFLDIKLEKGQSRYLQLKEEPKIVASSFHDRAKCHFITNCIRPPDTENQLQQGLPDVVSTYRQNMGHVDRANRSVLMADWPHKNIKWTNAYFWYLLALCVSNARAFMQQRTGQKINMTSFLEQLVIQWLASFPEVRKPLESGQHGLKKVNSSRRCKHCTNKRLNRAATPWLDPICKVHLHPGCIVGYHNEQ
jgi:hypothetical protein